MFSSMLKKNVLIGILLASILLGIAPVVSMAAPSLAQPAQEEQQNLSINPGFEGLQCAANSPPGKCHGNYDIGRVHIQDGKIRDNIFTPQGWVVWWREGGDYGQPEVHTIPADDPRYSYDAPLPRIHGGMYAVKLFNYYRQQDAGVYQCVSGLQAGATVQLTAYGQGWSCDESPGSKLGYSCGDPWNQQFQVGIEPNGAADPFSPNIAWSPGQLSADRYSLIGPATAQVGESGSVCIFLRSTTKWIYKYQDAYWDDVSLVMTSPGVPPTNTPPPPPPPPTDGPSPTPRPTPTPRPDGAIVHVVQSGDTLFGISLMYNVPLDQIRQLNAASVSGDIINVGQELVISLPSETPTPPPAPMEEPAQVAEGNPGSTTGASICVAAFKDRNGDGLRNGDEELLPNATIKVVNADGVIVNQRTTDGLNEPHCFTGLAAGSYRIIQEPPPDYTSSGQAEQIAAVAEGTSVQLSFGSVRGDEAGGDATPTQTSGGGLGGGSILPTLFSIAGVLMLLLAGGMAVLFVLNRRRM